MPLTLEAIAKKYGVEPSQLRAATANAKPEPSQTGAADDAKVYQYHLPYLTVGEVREYLGFPHDVPGHPGLSGRLAGEVAAEQTAVVDNASNKQQTPKPGTQTIPGNGDGGPIPPNGDAPRKARAET